MATESQTSQNNNVSLGAHNPGAGADRDIVGQKITVTDRTITAITFKLMRIGSPDGNLYFRIYDQTGYPGTLIYEELFMANSAVSNSSPTDYSLTLAVPQYFSQGVRLVLYSSNSQTGSNYVVLYYQSTDVKSGEYLCFNDLTPTPVWDGPGGVEGDGSGDAYYIYTYTSGDVTTDPAVTTQAVSAITDTTATGNGTVVVVGGATQHGHVWTTVDSPARPNLTDDAARKTTNGVPSLGAFTSSLTGLTANTTYYVRAYITSSNGTTYGDIVSFTTLATTDPTITTQAVTSITSSNAVGNGNVVSAGGYTITHHGIAWATHPVPTASETGDTYAETASGATGSFNEAITPLLVNNVYYVRAYVKTSTSLYFYGNEVSFTTSAGLPIVTTQLTTNVQNTTARGNLTLVSNGGSTITQYGVVYSTATHADPGNVLPSASDYESYTEEGAAGGTFPQTQTSDITNLLPNTQYYLRGYATNSTGTAYGDEVSFTTKITGAPVVTTDDIFSMTYTTATVRGTILDIGASAVTEHGIVWATSANPTTADSKSADTGPEAVGQFAEDATSLTAGTTYYVRAYATNTQGTAYGDNIEFIAGEPGAGVYFVPANAFTRVSGIVEEFWAGGSTGIYQQIFYLGGNTTTYISPVGNREVKSAVTPTAATLAGQGFQQADYERWLVNNSIDEILRVFGHFPTYRDWLLWIQSGGVSILGLGPRR